MPHNRPVDGAAIYLRPRSRHLDYRPLAEFVGEDTLLTWCVRRIAHCVAPLTPVVVCQEGDTQHYDLAALASHARVCVLPVLTELQACLQLSEAERWEASYWLHTEHALAPQELISQCRGFYNSSAHAMVSCTGVPMLVRPLLLSSSALSVLTAIQLPSPLASPNDAFNVLARSQHVSGLGAHLSVGLFSYSGVPCPSSLCLETKDDVAVARTAIAQGEPYFNAWRSAKGSRQAGMRAAHVTPRREPTSRNGHSRVLYVSNTSGWGGAEMATTALIKEVARRHRYSVTALVTLEGTFARSLRSAGCEVMCTDHSLSDDSLEAFSWTRRAIQSTRPLLLHVNGRVGPAVILAAAAAGVPIVAHVRVPLLTGWERLLDAARRVIAVSPSVAQQVIRHSNRPDGEILVIPSGVDVDRFHYDPALVPDARRRYRVSDDAAVISVVARYSTEKRHDLLMEAFAIVKTMIPNAHLICVGEPSSQDSVYHSLHVARQRLALGEAVTLLGYEDDPRYVYAASDVSVLVSDYEGLGLSVLEALHMGAHVVVTGNCGVAAYLEDEPRATIVVHRTPDAIASAIVSGVRRRRAETLTGPPRLGGRAGEVTLERTTMAVMKVYDSVKRSYASLEGYDAH